jgi:hypothetical protein
MWLTILCSACGPSVTIFKFYNQSRAMRSISMSTPAARCNDQAEFIATILAILDVIDQQERGLTSASSRRRFLCSSTHPPRASSKDSSTSLLAVLSRAFLQAHMLSIIHA